MFKTEPGHPELLHIFARHTTTIDEALAVFFDPTAASNWNATHRRWETRSATHELHWFWLQADRVVMVITCVRHEL